MTILEFCGWLQDTGAGRLVRESTYGFQIAVATHLLGIVFSVGLLLWFDLRLMGLCAQRWRVTELYRGLAPWFLGGFVVVLVSGVLLFIGYATAAYGNLFFRIKVAALLLAGANALYYHFTSVRTMPAWDTAPRPPGAARMAGAASLLLWTIVIVAGRMMSYTMF
jgi:hypothetical protein